MRFTKSEGLTESEALLASLCEQSFFALWTYPNLFKKAAKEMIDLMVVFRNDVLLFSDKSCAYPETDNPELDWKRWYSRAVAKSAHQVQQAERWLRSQPTRIFLDAKATEPLPIDLPPPDTLKIHLICDALMGIPPLVTAIGRSRWKLSTKRTSQNPFPLVTQWQGRCR